MVQKRMLSQKERVESGELTWRWGLYCKEKTLSEKAHRMNCSVRLYFPKITSATHLITLSALLQWTLLLRVSKKRKMHTFLYVISCSTC